MERKRDLKREGDGKGKGERGKDREKWRGREILKREGDRKREGQIGKEGLTEGAGRENRGRKREREFTADIIIIIYIL